MGVFFRLEEEGVAFGHRVVGRLRLVASAFRLTQHDARGDLRVLDVVHDVGDVFQGNQSVLMSFGTGMFTRAGRRRLSVRQGQSSRVHRGLQRGDFVHRRELTSSVNHLVDRTSDGFLSPQLRATGSPEIFDKKVLRENQFELRGDEKGVVERLLLLQLHSDGVGVEHVVVAVPEMQTGQVFTQTVQSSCGRLTEAVLRRRLRARNQAEVMGTRVGGSRRTAALARRLIANERREVRVLHFGDRLHRLQIEISRLRGRLARRRLQTEVIVVGRVVLEGIFEVDVQLRRRTSQRREERSFSYCFGSFQFGWLSNERRIGWSGSSAVVRRHHGGVVNLRRMVLVPAICH